MHFIGVLFGGDLSLLEDFYEGLEVESYIQSTKEEAIKDYIEAVKKGRAWRKKRIKEGSPQSSAFQEWLDKHKRYGKKRAWEDIQKDYKDQLDEDGNIWATCNPNAQWDWYRIGGRWSDYFPLKERDSEGNRKYADEATIGEVDWDEYKKTKTTPYCFITESGEWKSRGEIHWFSSTNDKNNNVWEKEFYNELHKYPDDTQVIAVDFHI